MKYSKRAAILSRVLGYINSGDYDISGEFLIFGKEAFERHIGLSDEAFGFEDPLRELLSTAKIRRGKDSVQKRISLKNPSEGFTEDERKAWKDFSLRFPIFEQLVESLLSNPTQLNPVVNAQHGEPEDRDAALALESLEWLDQAAARLDGLNEVPIEVGLAHNELYFEEAHKCDLAGRKIATAVLCRAVLESALDQVVDPGRVIKRRAKQSGESHIGLMLEEAQKAGRLCAERVKVGRDIKKAGDAAIHDLQRFQASYWERMNEIIDGTRKVLEDLYRNE